MNAPTRFPAARRASYPSKAVIARMVKAARDLGLDVIGFEAQPDGTVRVLDRSAAPAPVQAPRDEFEEWEASGNL